MLVVITYDVNTEDSNGKRRLRQVSKMCVNYGQRVQNSVFECILDYSQQKELKHKLSLIIDPEKDSLRFYYLGVLSGVFVNADHNTASIDLKSAK